MSEADSGSPTADPPRESSDTVKCEGKWLGADSGKSTADPHRESSDTVKYEGKWVKRILGSPLHTPIGRAQIL